MVDGAKAVATDHQATFVASLLEHGDEFLAAAAEALQKADADAARALDSFEEAARRGRVLRALRHELDPDSLQGRSVIFAVGDDGRLGGKVREAVEALRAQVS